MRTAKMKKDINVKKKIQQKRECVKKGRKLF